MTIAIIGAGMAGLSCAQALAAAGVEVRLFDKGRGPGGRMSSRRANTPLGELRFDHGASFIEASTPDFADAIDAWVEAGVATKWETRVAKLTDAGAVRQIDNRQKWVGTPGMNAIIRFLADGLDVCWGRRIAEISGAAGDWQLRFEDGSIDGPFEAVFVAVPAEQVPPLLEPVAPAIAEAAGAIQSTPCWSAMLAFDAPVRTDFDLAEGAHGPLGRLVRDTSKPGRVAGDAWTVQATADWSAAHVENDANDAAASLTDAFRALTDAPQPVHAVAHRWRYARPSNAPGCACRLERAIGIGACGDWHLGNDAEAAWMSGQALAKTWIG